MSEDWRSYDGIAGRYDAAWAPRFQQVAAHLSRRLPTRERERILDVGSGTGIVARVLQADRPDARVIGCDRAIPMLRQLAARTPRIAAVAATATALPFARDTFTIATASFVLSHLPECEVAVREIHRVLARGGVFAASAWAPASDPYAPAWSECLTRVIPKERVQQAFSDVTPSEDYLAQPGALAAVLERAGFARVEQETIDVNIDVTLDQFVADRQLNSAARLAQSTVGAKRWADFLSMARETLHARFGSSIRYTRQAHIAIGRHS